MSTLKLILSNFSKVITAIFFFFYFFNKYGFKYSNIFLFSTKKPVLYFLVKKIMKLKISKMKLIKYNIFYNFYNLRNHQTHTTRF